MNNEYTSNNYLVDDEEVIFRRANELDNKEEIAELIYNTDPFIYPFWFHHNIEEGKKTLVENLSNYGFFYNLNNIYLAYNKSSNKIIGIINAVDKTVDLNYNYTDLINQSKEGEFTILNYINGLIDEVNKYDPEDMYISNVCITEEERGKQIGKRMLGYFISQMEKRHYTRFHLDCLLHNLRAKNLYHSLGFREMEEVVGFDGTNNSKVEAVAMLRKKGEYLPEEFKVKD